MFICHIYIPPICSKVLNDRDFDFFKRSKRDKQNLVD